MEFYKIFSTRLSSHLHSMSSEAFSVRRLPDTLSKATITLGNTRRLFNILNMPSTNTPEMVVSLDAEKAFQQGGV